MEISFRLLDGELRYRGDFPKNDQEGMAISIAKWEYLANPDNYSADLDAGDYPKDGGTWTCGLCMIHRKVSGCGRCPIALSGHEFCEETPYEDYGDSTCLDDAVDAARRELDFLITIQEELKDE